MQVSSNQQYNPKFNAQLLAQWQCLGAGNKPKNITLVAFEKRDLEFVKKFRTDLDKFRHLTPIKQAIIDASSQMLAEILEKKTDEKNKIRMFGAIYDGDLCGLLIANVPKKLPVTEMTIYSSRHNPAKNETELDWLVTWTPLVSEKIKGIGKALVGEYFKTVKKDKFRDVFVRSEIPEHSYAVNFYESLGFERLSNRRAKLANKNTNPYLINNFADPEDEIIPMIISRRSQQATLEKLEKSMCRQEFVKKSVDIEDLIK